MPIGTVTFLFTDIEGSSKLWEDFPEAMQPALARHDALLRQAVETQGGTVFKTVGDGFYVAFPTAPQAFSAALAAQSALVSEAWPFPLRVRMALHSGMAEQRDGDYFGVSLNRVARLLAAGHGGQVLLSAAAQELTRDYLPLQSALRDLGEIRLRDLARPEHVFQLLSPGLTNDFPPLKSLDNPEFPNNLPQQLTSLIGREKESAEVVRLLQSARLLTITGAGGCGKTRLALQAAADLLEECPDGVWFVELAPLTDAALVPQTVANILKVTEEAGKPLLQTLTEKLKAKKLVLVLDNCEHVLAAVAALADTLRRALPQIRLLATSREPLNISGETVYRVPSLSLPEPGQAQTPESLSHYEAARLFIDRALAVAPNFTVTNANAPALAAICHRLDGIPFALELAAARSRSMPLEQIAARLDNRFQLLTGGSRAALPRQQTLRALIDWSFSLLTEAEQNLFCRLSIFADGWTLEAAEAVCSGAEAADSAGAIQNPDSKLQDWEILDLLTSLADKSLVVYAERDGAARYRLLESVRQYADDRLTERGGCNALRVRHRDYYIALAIHTDPQGKDAERNLAVLETEHANLRAALSAPFDDPESVERRLESVRSVGWFQQVRGYYSEARGILQTALAAEGKGRTEARAAALIAASIVNHQLGIHEEARCQIEESIAIRREGGQPLQIAKALMTHGIMLGEMGEFAAGKQVLEEGLQISLANGGNGMGIYGNLGFILFYLGEYSQSEIFHTKELALNRQEGIKDWEANSLYELGRLALIRADHAAAHSYFLPCLRICGDLDYKGGLLDVLFGFSLLASAEGRNERACGLLGARDALHQSLGTRLWVAEQPEYDCHIAALRAALGAAAFSAAYEAGRARDWRQAIAWAREVSMS